VPRGFKTTGVAMPMVSAWGSTETSPLATDCHFQAERSGNIGVPFPGTELKLVPAGDKFEARLRGPNVTPGKLNKLCVRNCGVQAECPTRSDPSGSGSRGLGADCLSYRCDQRGSHRRLLNDRRVRRYGIDSRPRCFISVGGYEDDRGVRRRSDQPSRFDAIDIPPQIDIHKNNVRFQCHCGLDGVATRRNNLAHFQAEVLQNRLKMKGDEHLVFDDDGTCDFLANL
jgi:acyl-CoA synthetase (AMP-forming)/AMP-acid ligase II